MKLIAFSGSMGCGKSTAISFLQELNPNGVKNLKFAQPLYDMQESIYNRVINVHRRPESFVKDRKLLQWLGTEWGRDTISETLWVDLWKTEVNYAVNNYSHLTLTCDDLRFTNEVAAVKEMGGIIIKLTSHRNHERIDTASGIVKHQSEDGIADHLADFVVPNNGTIEDFKSSLRPIFESVLKGLND